jgi:homoserine O-succinyltransferase
MHQEAALSLSQPPHGWRAGTSCDGSGSVVVGLVNNMPDGALLITERQYRRLLSNLPGKVTVRLRLFTLPGIGRAPEVELYVARHYDPLEALWTSTLDGLIVSGTEPRAPVLTQEPCWPSLTRLVDWAEAHTVSSIWSCLAAHAAVRHFDAIERRALPQKLSGVFACAPLGNHPLLEDLPPQWRVPHSRCNEIAEDQLIAHGYRILTRSPAAGPDIFAKQGRALHVFLQGHPEYDWGILSREYRRDVKRFLTGEQHGYPDMPQNYFDADASTALLAFRQQALAQRHAELLAEFPNAALPDSAVAPWTEVAARFFANWLAYIARRKSSAPAAASAHAAADF